MNEQKLLELIFDKIANNSEYEQFDPDKFDTLCLNYRDAEIEIEHDGKLFILKIKQV